MTREEREALLETETPDLPEPPSPYKAGARRLVGIIIVSLIISAAVSISLILTLTAGLPARVKRDVLAELQGEKDAAKPELPNEAVLVYVPEECRQPLSSDPTDHAVDAKTTGVLEAAVADKKVQDTVWYAANAQRPVDALREALQVTPWSEARVLLFSSEALPEADRQTIFSRAAKAYVAHCLAQVRPVAEAKLKEIQAKEQGAADRLKALRDQYTQASADGRVQLGLAVLEYEAWTEASTATARWKESVVFNKVPWMKAGVEAALRLAAQRAADLKDGARENRKALVAAQTLERKCEMAQRRVWKWRIRHRRDEARQGRADPSLPHVLREGKIQPDSVFESAVAEVAPQSAVRAEREALLRAREAAQTAHDNLARERQALAAEPMADLQHLKSKIAEQVGNVIHWEAELKSLHVQTEYLEANPPAAPDSRPASRPAEAQAESSDPMQAVKDGSKHCVGNLRKAREQLDSLVGQYVEGWRTHQRCRNSLLEVLSSLRLLDLLDARIDELDIVRAGETAGP